MVLLMTEKKDEKSLSYPKVLRKTFAKGMAGLCKKMVLG